MIVQLYNDCARGASTLGFKNTILQHYLFVTVGTIPKAFYLKPAFVIVFISTQVAMPIIGTQFMQRSIGLASFFP